jgi:phytoene dehydrogenase-like protein
MPSPGKIVVIGGGIAGLCTAVYARKCGYDVEIIEMHDTTGGLATSWHRGGYAFETCLHWQRVTGGCSRPWSSSCASDTGCRRGPARRSMT